MQWSEKMQKLQKLHFKLYRPQLARQMLHFATVHLEKDSISMSCLEELSKINIAAQLRFAHLHLNKSQDF